MMNYVMHVLMMIMIMMIMITMIMSMIAMMMMMIMIINLTLAIILAAPTTLYFASAKSKMNNYRIIIFPTTTIIMYHINSHIQSLIFTQQRQHNYYHYPYLSPFFSIVKFPKWSPTYKLSNIMYQINKECNHWTTTKYYYWLPNPWINLDYIKGRMNEWWKN